MSEINITILPDGTMRIETEAPDDRACRVTESVIRATMAKLGCAIEEGTETKKTAIPVRADTPRVKGS